MPRTRLLVAVAVVSLVTVLALVIPASTASPTKQGMFTAIQDKYEVVRPAPSWARGKGIKLRDKNALWLAGAYLEPGDATAPMPTAYFLNDEEIDLALIFDYFGNRSAGIRVTAILCGDTVFGKFKDKATALISVGDMADVDEAISIPIHWLRVNALAEGRYKFKVKLKGIKPCKARGKAELYFDVFSR